jgi:hypothetical protein
MLGFMEVLRSTRFRIGAPAVVVLATVVNAAAACDQSALLPQHSAPDLAWAVNGGATQVSNTRTILAQRAVKTIRTLDRYFGAQPAMNVAEQTVVLASVPQSHEDVLPLCTLQSESTHQHSAP